MEELTPAQNYRFALIEAINQLIDNRNDIEERMINLAMAGEFAEINDMFEEGDTIPADVEYFKNCKDINVQQLLKLYCTVDDMVPFFMNVNNIREEELDMEVEE